LRLLDRRPLGLALVLDRRPLGLALVLALRRALALTEPDEVGPGATRWRANSLLTLGRELVLTSRVLCSRAPRGRSLRLGVFALK